MNRETSNTDQCFGKSWAIETLSDLGSRLCITIFLIVHFQTCEGSMVLYQHFFIAAILTVIINIFKIGSEILGSSLLS